MRLLLTFVQETFLLPLLLLIPTNVITSFRSVFPCVFCLYCFRCSKLYLVLSDPALQTDMSLYTVLVECRCTCFSYMSSVVTLLFTYGIQESKQ